MSTVTALFLERAARHPDRPALRTLAAGGPARDAVLTWGEWALDARRFAAALVAGGHRPGDAVAILAGSRALWPIADLGALMAGGVSVGVYPTSAPAQVRQVLADCGAVVAVTDTVAQLAKVAAIRADLPALRISISQEVNGVGEATGWDAWLDHGAEVLASRPEIGEEIDRRIATAGSEDDIAILIYTSGSTGEPKGAAISHRYLLASAASIRDTLGFVEDDTMLSFLPYCHAAERVFGLYTRILCGMEAALVEDHTRVWDAARAYGPTVFGGLPRFYEKAYETLSAERLQAAGPERERWERTLELGTDLSRLRRAGLAAPRALEAEWRSVGSALIDRARGLFGGRARLATSGGATLPVEVVELLDALGVTVLGGYGLTEHLCVAFNRPGAYGFDTAGPPMCGTEVRIAADGEILVRRGPLTFAGYHGRPEESRAAFSADGEWLLTGDLGELTGAGALRVTGRKKELIALSTGKKVAPLPIESQLVRDPWIGQAMLYGEGERFISALLALRPSAVHAWARERDLPAGDPAVLRHPELIGHVQAAVDRVNAGLSRTEQVRRFVLLERELSVDADELTPTLKLRRAAIAEKYRPQLEALYRSA